jgi:hypothetical protein
MTNKPTVCSKADIIVGECIGLRRIFGSWQAEIPEIIATENNGI